MKKIPGSSKKADADAGGLTLFPTQDGCFLIRFINQTKFYIYTTCAVRLVQLGHQRFNSGTEVEVGVFPVD